MDQEPDHILDRIGLQLSEVYTCSFTFFAVSFTSIRDTKYLILFLQLVANAHALSKMTITANSCYLRLNKIWSRKMLRMTAYLLVRQHREEGG